MGNFPTRSTVPSEKTRNRLLDIDILQTVEAKHSRCYEKRNPRGHSKSLSESKDGIQSNKDESISLTGSKKCNLSTHSTNQKAEEASDLKDLPLGAKHPGLLRYLHNAARNIEPKCFEGATFKLDHSVSPNLVLGHTVALTSISPGGYRLQSRYTSAKKEHLLLVDVDPTGNWNVDLRFQPTKNTRTSLVAQLGRSALLFCECAIDWYGSRSTASLQFVNEKTVALHYLQAFSDKFSLGAEVVLHSSIAETSTASAAARYVEHDWTVSSTLSKRGIELCYSRMARPNLDVAAILEIGFISRRCLATLAYEYRGDLCIIRGSADTDGRVGATVDHALVATNRARISCAISCLANHTNDKFQLGFYLSCTLI